MKKKYLVLCLFICVTAMVTYNPVLAKKTPPSNANNTQNLASWAGPISKNMLFAYLGCFAYSVSHEFGHAIMNKLFTGSKINIHLGSLKETKNPLFRTNNITIHSLNPMKGFAKFEKIPQKNWQRFLVSVAGGAFGAAQSYLVLSGMAAFHKYRACSDLTRALGYGFKNALFPFKNVHLNKKLTKPELYCHVALVALALMLNLRTLLYSFLPGDKSVLNLLPTYNSKTDGSRAWTEMGVSCETQDLVAFASYIVEWILRAVIVKKSIDCIRQYSRD